MLFTESPNIVDKLISLMTGEDCGHFAILFESVNETGVVFESNLLGAHPKFYSTWMKNRTIIHSIDFILTDQQEKLIWNRWVSNFDGRGYDFLGALFLGLCKWRRRIFGVPLPPKNAWSRKNTFFCDVIYQVLSEIADLPPIPLEQNGMYTPHDLWAVLNSSLTGKR